MAEDRLTKEYFVLLDIVKDFDQRLLTIKGWGVTLSLAALGFGFQYQHYGFFLVAALSGFAFWAIESLTKRHQMLHYVRLREIEVQVFEQVSEKSFPIVTPQINWSWCNAADYYRGLQHGPPLPPKRYEKAHYDTHLWLTPFDLKLWLYPHVMLPHIISFLVGTLFFLLGWLGWLNMRL